MFQLIRQIDEVRMVLSVCDFESIESIGFRDIVYLCPLIASDSSYYNGEKIKANMFDADLLTNQQRRHTSAEPPIAAIYGENHNSGNFNDFFKNLIRHSNMHRPNLYIQIL